MEVSDFFFTIVGSDPCLGGERRYTLPMTNITADKLADLEIQLFTMKSKREGFIQDLQGEAQYLAKISNVIVASSDPMQYISVLQNIEVTSKKIAALQSKIMTINEALYTFDTAMATLNTSITDRYAIMKANQAGPAVLKGA